MYVCQLVCISLLAWSFLVRYSVLKTLEAKNRPVLVFIIRRANIKERKIQLKSVSDFERNFLGHFYPEAAIF